MIHHTLTHTTRLKHEHYTHTHRLFTTEDNNRTNNTPYPPFDHHDRRDFRRCPVVTTSPCNYVVMMVIIMGRFVDCSVGLVVVVVVVVCDVVVMFVTCVLVSSHNVYIIRLGS